MFHHSKIEGVGAGSPVGKEQAKANGLEHTGNGTDSDGVKRALLAEAMKIKEPSSGCGLLAVEVLLLGVGLLRAAVGITEDGTENGQRDGVVEGRAESNGRGLDGRE
ncbi:hypothetical protein HBH56_225910 [Parastagonospora nodorum]|nr:hypothetical protein HBH56_225910 [Parastagonospora nodorum]KAH3940012.1 hypothetical protein HBH53_223950 [Parastagonospora nodorum]KAH3992203.1 hypothetical protein HBI10_220210 [Parastagonospora nodorum]KAH4009016.1 hypothetical protein HBI13_226260 [Parastagonospora nodorum]KAH4057940.1 hypothetical protein HBH50_233890 [Parastagonospora nodorum]